MAVSINWGRLVGCPYNKIRNILVFVLGSLISGNFHVNIYNTYIYIHLLPGSPMLFGSNPCMNG